VEVKKDNDAEAKNGDELETKKDNNTKVEKESDAEAKEEDLNVQTETHEALLHMRLLKELLTNQLGRTLKLHQGVETGTARKVHFEDLWLVFRYGQEVRSSGSKKTQL